MGDLSVGVGSFSIFIATKWAKIKKEWNLYEIPRS
jgi:hypothetical protein